MNELKALPEHQRPCVQTILDGNVKLVIPVLQRQLQNQIEPTILHFLLRSSSEIIRRLTFQALVCGKFPLTEAFFAAEVLPLLQSKQLLTPVVIQDMPDYLTAKRLGMPIDTDFVRSKDMQQGVAYYLLEKYYTEMKSAELGSYCFCMLVELREYMQHLQFLNFEAYLASDVVFNSGVIVVMLQLAESTGKQISSRTIIRAIHYSLCQCRAFLVKCSVPVVENVDELLVEFQDFLSEISASTPGLSPFSRLLIAIQQNSYTSALFNDVVRNYSSISINNKLLLSHYLSVEELSEARNLGLRELLSKEADFPFAVSNLDLPDMELLDKRSFLIVLDRIRDRQLKIPELCRVFNCAFESQCSSYELNRIFKILLHIAVRNPEFVASNDFRQRCRQMFSFAIKNPHFTDFLLAFESYTSIELILAAIICVPPPNLDPQAFELETMHLLTGNGGIGSNALIRLLLIKRLLVCVQNDQTVVNQMLALERATDSLLYAAGEPRLLEFSKDDFWADGSKVRKQVQFLKVLRRVIAAQRLGDTLLAGKLFEGLNAHGWQRVTRTVWEQIISMLFINSGRLFMKLADLPAGEGESVALQSALMITGHVALHVDAESMGVDSFAAITRSVGSLCMSKYPLIRQLAKQILLGLDERFPARVPALFVQAIKDALEDGERRIRRVIDQISEFVGAASAASQADICFPYERPALELLQNPRYSDDLSDIIAHAQFVSDPRTLDNLRRRMRFQERFFVSEAAPQQLKIAVQESRAKFSVRVLAALLDNGVNLGGICRTCEVFGAEELILSGPDAARSDAFRSAAVSADQHVQVDFWARESVVCRLREARAQGWKAVALEQCSGSTPLGEFAFPEKTLVVLGNERAGIPGDVLRECDFFVEIPQFGVVRSLNVHVSCALALWEYVRRRK